MATAKKEVREVKKPTFRDFLKRSNAQIKDDRADRLGQSVKMSYSELINKKKKELFNLEDELELMTDLSADNRTTSMNSVRDLDGDAFVEKRAELLVKKTLLEQKIKIIEADASFYDAD